MSLGAGRESGDERIWARPGKRVRVSVEVKGRYQALPKGSHAPSPVAVLSPPLCQTPEAMPSVPSSSATRSANSAADLTSSRFGASHEGRRRREW